MKYTIHWLEYINPEYVCEDLDISFYEIDEEDNPENYKKVLKEILKGLPPKSKHTGGYPDAWEFECEDIFEANNIKEAKQLASEYDCGDTGVFTVIDEKGNRVFDEQDL